MKEIKQNKLRVALANVHEKFGSYLEGTSFERVDDDECFVVYYFDFEYRNWEYPVTVFVDRFDASVSLKIVVTQLPHPEHIDRSKLGKLAGEYGSYTVKVENATFTIESDDVAGGQMTVYTIEKMLNEMAEISEPLLVMVG